MKVHLTTFVHASNGMKIDLIPETDFESKFLKAFAESNATLEGCGQPSNEDKFSPVGYAIRVTRGDMKTKT